MQNQENNEVIYAGFFVRLAAFLLDSIIVGLPLLFLRLPVFFISLFQGELAITKPMLFEFSFWDIFLYSISVTYFILFTYVTGFTLGKKVLCLKVVSTDGEKLTLLNVIYRETIGRYLSTLIFSIGYILIGLDSEKKGLHDTLCDTRVVYDFKRRKTKEISKPMEIQQEQTYRDSWNEEPIIEEPIIEEPIIEEPIVEKTEEVAPISTTEEDE